VSFNFFLIVFFVGGWFASRLARSVHLPGVLGMLLWGVVLSTASGGSIPPLVHDLEPFLKSAALIVILLRAGLGIRRDTLSQVGTSALLIATIPIALELAAATWLYRQLFGFELLPAIIGASVLSAVSLAVVVPSMLDLKHGGYGEGRAVPTTVLAGASLDNIVAVTVFTTAVTMQTGAEELGGPLDVARLPAPFEIPLSILAGIALGLLIGFGISRFFTRYHGKIRATEKTLLLLMVALLAVEAGNAIHIAALLTVMTVGFVLLESNERVAHELALKLGKVWVISEIVLFVLIGMAVDVPTALSAGARGMVIILGGLVARSVGVLIATAPNRRFTVRDRTFCVASYIPKATVQAALGSVPLAMGVPGGAEILAVSVLAIILTAPAGLALIEIFGPRLLDRDGAPLADPPR
jgi:NhaP-type Na+/H+ or K+/H+ antiporter